MKKALFAAACAVFMLGSGAEAQETRLLGRGSLFTNDAIGDSKDRWRSGSYVVSRVMGAGFDGALPQQFGALREWRLRTEVIQPASLTAPGPTDRRYAGVFSLGLHSHLALGAAEASLGGDLVVTGPQTGIGSLQRATHKALGLRQPLVLGNQIGNRVHPTLLAEVGLPLALGDRGNLRPFVEGQLGVESFVRVGADMVLGDFGRGALMLRDVTTGQRYRGAASEPIRGASLVLGGDVAHVGRSAFLPRGGGATLSDSRTRLRAGVHWQGEKSELFYGVTRLGREFDEQPSGQTLGSVRLRLRF